MIPNQDQNQDQVMENFDRASVEVQSEVEMYLPALSEQVDRERDSETAILPKTVLPTQATPAVCFERKRLNKRRRRMKGQKKIEHIEEIYEPEVEPNSEVPLLLSLPSAEPLESDAPTACERLLRTDVVIEEIIKNVKNQSDLFNCRLVCKKWHYFSTRQLRMLPYTELEIIFDNFVRCRRNKKKVLKSSGKALVNLIELLKHPFQKFPCGNFNFISFCKSDALCESWKNLSNTMLQRFLKKFGKEIRQLRIRSSHTNPVHCLPESKVIEQVRQTLQLTPNLEFLSLSIDFAVEWINSPFTRNRVSPLLPSDPEYNQIHSDPRNSPVLKKLTTVQSSCLISAKILETILLLGPGINDVRLDGNGHHAYFLEPENRTHLIKILSFTPNQKVLPVFERFAQLLRAPRSTIQIEQFRVNFGVEKKWEYDAVVRTVAIFNTVMQELCDSLEEVDCHGLVPLCGLKWPQNLKKVHELRLGRPLRLPGSFTPLGYQIPTVFTHLRKVVLYNYTGKKELLRLANSLSSDARLLVNVVWIDVKKAPISNNLLKKIQRRFPNAAVQEGEICVLPAESFFVTTVR